MGRCWDGYLKNEILREIHKELKRAKETEDEMSNEVWLTAKQLSQEMPFFTITWLRHNGFRLHSRMVCVKDENYECKFTKRYYPKNAILKRLRETKITDSVLIRNIKKYQASGGKIEIGGFDYFPISDSKLSIEEAVYRI